MNEERIVGRNAVIEALKAGREISKIYLLYSAHGGRLDEIYALAKRGGISISRVDSKQFAEMTAHLTGDQSPQGIVATISRVKFHTIDDVLAACAGKKSPLLLVLDRIQDPQNFGAILRSASFFGVDGVIVAREGQAPLNEAAVKASAGGAFHVMLARESNLHQTLTYLKEKGFWIATGVPKAPVSMAELDFNVPLAVIIGNEGSGVRRLLRDKSDMTFSIPQIGRIDSLNVSVATGIICYEILRQRGMRK